MERYQVAFVVTVEAPDIEAASKAASIIFQAGQWVRISVLNERTGERTEGSVRIKI